jgi:hypothetical protein
LVEQIRWIFIHPFIVLLPRVNLTPEEKTMNKALHLFLLIIILVLNACSPRTATPDPVPTSVPPAPTALPANQPADPVETQAPQEPAPEPWETYSNNDFGLAFRYPAGWFGPQEYISGSTLRVEVGSGPVYPYGTPLDQRSPARNSYSIVVQYTKDNQNMFFEDTYQSLLNLQDRQSLSTARSLLIRVRQLELYGYKGFEYISTLSETAQTEAVYAREVILVDGSSNLITIFGSPDNVEIGEGANWRDAYRAIDEANQEFFHQVVESMVVE